MEKKMNLPEIKLQEKFCRFKPSTFTPGIIKTIVTKIEETTGSPSIDKLDMNKIAIKSGVKKFEVFKMINPDGQQSSAIIGPFLISQQLTWIGVDGDLGKTGEYPRTDFFKAEYCVAMNNRSINSELCDQETGTSLVSSQVCKKSNDLLAHLSKYILKNITKVDFKSTNAECVDFLGNLTHFLDEYPTAGTELKDILLKEYIDRMAIPSYRYYEKNDHRPGTELNIFSTSVFNAPFKQIDGKERREASLHFDEDESENVHETLIPIDKMHSSIREVVMSSTLNKAGNVYRRLPVYIFNIKTSAFDLISEDERFLLKTLHEDTIMCVEVTIGGKLCIPKTRKTTVKFYLSKIFIIGLFDQRKSAGVTESIKIDISKEDKEVFELLQRENQTILAIKKEFAEQDVHSKRKFEIPKLDSDTDDPVIEKKIKKRH